MGAGRTLAIVIILLVVSIAARAEVVAVCGASEGRSYFPPSTLVSAKDGGWQEDRISEGSFQLVRSGENYDIIFTDATGGTLSSKGDGGHVATGFDTSGNLLVTVLYPGVSIETYVFWFALKGERVATYSQAKYGATIPKHSLMKATCQW